MPEEVLEEKEKEEKEEEKEEDVKELEFTISAKDMITFAKAVSTVVSNCPVRINIDSEGWHVVQTNSEHVSLVNYTEREFMANDGIEERVIVVDMDYILSFLNKMKYDGIVFIKIDKDSITFNANGITRKFPLHDTDEIPETKIPQLEYDAKIVVEDAEKLYKIIDIAETLSEYIIITTQDGECVIEAEEEFVNEGMKAKIYGEISGEAKSKYAIEYLKPVIKMVKELQKRWQGEKITIEYKTDYPIKIAIADVYYLIAPRVE